MYFAAILCDFFDIITIIFDFFDIITITMFCYTIISLCTQVAFDPNH